MNYELLNNKIDELQDEMIAAIQENMRIESVRGEAQPDAPYGVGPKAALDNVLALGEKLGFKTGNADNRVGWVEFGEGEEMVGVLGHLDVVPAGEGWEHPAYGAEIHDGVLWGRGIMDDKGPTIGAIYALKAIRDLELPIDRRIRVLFGTDEECGSSCVEYYVHNGYELPTLGFTPDAQFPAIFYEKGISHLHCKSKVTEKGNIDVVSLEGGTVANTVTGKCKLVVNGPLKVTTSDRVTVEEVDGQTIVKAEGEAAHGSTPHLGINAAALLFEAVKENDFGGSFQKMFDFLYNKVGTETNGESLGVNFVDEETGDTTCNLGIVRYDGEEMYFTLDLRYPNNTNKEVVDPIVEKAIAEYGFAFDKKMNADCLYVPKDSELITKLVKVYEATTGLKDEPISIGGGTYAKEFPNMVGFGPRFLGDEDRIHKPNERIEIDRFMEAMKVIGCAMYELAQKDK